MGLRIGPELSLRESEPQDKEEIEEGIKGGSGLSQPNIGSGQGGTPPLIPS